MRQSLDAGALASRPQEHPSPGVGGSWQSEGRRHNRLTHGSSAIPGRASWSPAASLAVGTLGGTMPQVCGWALHQDKDYYRPTGCAA